MRSLLAQRFPVPSAPQDNAREVFEAGTIAAQAGGGEELLAAGVERVETGNERIDYLAQLREGIGVKAATTVTGGST